MFGSYAVELVFAVMLLIAAGTFGWYLHRASRRIRPPYVVRSDALLQAVTIVELSLVVFGIACLIDAMVRIASS